MWTIVFWKDVAERFVKTFVQALLAFITIEGTRIGFEDVHWARAFSVAGVAGVISVLSSIGSSAGSRVTGVGRSDSASLVK